MRNFKKCISLLLVLLTLCSFMNCLAADTDAAQPVEEENVLLAEETVPDAAAANEDAPALAPAKDIAVPEAEEPADEPAMSPQAPVITKIEGSDTPIETPEGSDPAPGDPTPVDPTPAEPVQPSEPAPALTVRIVTDTTEVRALSRLKLNVEFSGTQSTPDLKWESDKKVVATVNKKGEVFGLTVGKAIITVTATADGQTATDAVEIFVVQPFGQIHNFLRDHEVLGYQYSYPDDYYYTNDKKCWQKYFGFSKFYDLVSPYILLEYDYVRVYFTYEGKDWMIQFWKGQYGLVFYGCEVGVYTRRHSAKEPGVFTLYKCADEGDWLNMEQSMYHDTTGLGTYKREFTRPWGKYWWCTGFKRGHLRIEEPARELRSVGTIEMKDDEMTRLFTAGLEQCGFKRVDAGADLGLDCFSVEGRNVHFVWQNISHAETTMPIKALAVANVLAALCGPFALVGMFFLDIGLLLLL